MSRSPSPSVTSKSARRRVEASAHLSLQGTTRKRPSDGVIANTRSSKLTKSSKGKQPSTLISNSAANRSEPSLFKKPSLQMARSFNTLPASQSTVNTSFNTVSSSQQTRADTANTSFTSDCDATEVPYSFMTRTSPTTLGSLEDGDLLVVNAKLSKQASALESKLGSSHGSSQGRDSSSTWGSSIPEEDLIVASARAESSTSASLLHSRRLSPRRSAQHIGGSQPTLSPVKNGTFAHPNLAAMSLNQSFPPPPGVNVKLSPDKSASHSRSHSDRSSPARPQEQSPAGQASTESPTKIAHRIRDIPEQGLFAGKPGPNLRSMPYYALFICQRIALERSLPVTELVRSMDIAQACADPRVFWASLEEHPKVKNIKFKDSDRLWTAAKRNFEGFTFKGQINLRSKQSGPIFQLDLHPIFPDRSCRLQRKFGADRFLYLNVPELKKWTGGTQNDLRLIRERWKEWLSTEHDFLNRKWRVFHVEGMKKPKTKGRTADVTHRLRIVLFATEGLGIDEVFTVGQMLDWFLPFAQNLEQSFCKAFARYDLGLSRTTPTLVFKPSQVIRVNDTWSNQEREATEFDDPMFEWTRPSDRHVMNDGCSVMSVGAAREIWKIYRKIWAVDGPLPSAFQGRIGGAKGLWMISAESYTKDPVHQEIWIRISDSQLKFEPHPEDRKDTSFDPLRLTFEVSNYPSTAAPSDLHISFIPIMADRGVHRAIIASYMQERLEAERTELLEKMTNAMKLYEYVHKNGSTSKEGTNMTWQAAMPMALEDKIKLQLEAGFSPLKLQILAKNVSRFVKKQHLLQESKLRTPLGKATYLFGVADPTGLLRPGEVHIQFSSSFVDGLTNESYLNLRDHQLLVARQPACRNSDIQKVRATVLPELSHLVDLVVFPSKGQFPLAGKLQGGDYDGDIFWLCWEEELVAPFRNAPAPMTSPDPEQYGITVNRDKLRDLRVDVDDEMSVDDFLQKAFEFRSAQPMLGIATTYLEKQSYLENRLKSYKLDCLVDIHDLLVDSAKQGYTFTEEDWESYLREQLRCDPKLKKPVYKRVMEVCAIVKDYGADVDKARQKKYKHNKHNIIDYLYFEVVRKQNDVTIKHMQELLSSATEADPDLLYPRQQLAALKDPIIDEELRKAQEQMQQIYVSWNACTHKDDKEKATDDFGKVVEDLYARFQAIKPTNTDHPIIRSWLHHWFSPDFCMWDRLRASILYARLPGLNAQTFVFQMAGDELAKIKAERFPHTRYIVAEIRANMKPKPIRAPVQDDDEAGDDDDDDVADVLEQRML
ncbi:hypothetical protein E8E13_003603 [Curvularia kusanoi]|uniref:RNA-dependent RNA polymerase n=1 Tax=Curvularia kusanoi TaxID=90978 RepID=A0A9P4T6G1_CURKU|nr:hypothetical protein E8E13_003603 [Curvularia kusanoi]